MGKITDTFANVENYIFDFDGTLANSMPTWLSEMFVMLDKYNIAYDDVFIKQVVTMPTDEYCQRVNQMGVPYAPEKIKKILFENLSKHYENDILPKDGVADKIKQLYQMGKKLHILTASPQAWIVPCLKRNGLFEYFTNSWTCSDFGTNKSDPEIYKTAAERLGARIGDVLFFDDNVFAVKAAVQSGINTVAVYDECCKSDADEMKKIAAFYINGFSEI